MKILIGFIILLILGSLTLVSCSSLGTRPDKQGKKLFKNSSQYNKNKGIFENRMPNLVPEMKKKNMNWKVLTEWFKGGQNRVPSVRLPEIKPDIKTFLSKSDKAKVIWFGHSSFMINIEGKIILVDPVFSKSASPVSFLVKRFQKPILELDELPEIDFILISHDHYDHLDMKSIKFFKDKNVKFITPLGVGSHIAGWGISSSKIIEKDWWESIKFNDIEFIATPAQHFSGRDGVHDNETLWASWIIRSEKESIYFSGDSGYDTHFKDIGDRFGPFDIAFIESGQYNKNWEAVHMMPEQSVKAYKDLKAKKFFPVHWGMFELAMHAWNDPVIQLEKLSKGQDINLVVPKIGQIIEPLTNTPLDRWWVDITSK